MDTSGATLNPQRKIWDETQGGGLGADHLAGNTVDSRHSSHRSHDHTHRHLLREKGGLASEKTWVMVRQSNPQDDRVGDRLLIKFVS